MCCGMIGRAGIYVRLIHEDDDWDGCGRFLKYLMNNKMDTDWKCKLWSGFGGKI